MPTIPLSALLKIHNIHPRKALGQNFLHDPQIAQKIVTLSRVQPNDAILEIGPGLGSLTLPLLQQTHHVHAIEKDAQLLPILRTHTATTGTLTLIHDDALTFNYQALSNQLGKPLRIVANLPYAISTPLLIHLLEQKNAIQDMTLMLQKELAERMAAPPGGKDYGALSVHCQFWCHIEKLMTVPPEAFTPRPQVTSLVIRLTVRQTPAVPVQDPAWFNRVVRTAFGQRRKTLANALKPLGLPTTEWLTEAGIDPQRRAETLSLAEFAHLADNAPI